MNDQRIANYLNDSNAGVVNKSELRNLKLSALKKAPKNLMEIRDRMGWDAIDITTNSLAIADIVVKGHVQVRTYRRKNLDLVNLPLLIFAHGGGFFGGSIQNVEQICRAFADKSDVLVASVGYRLTPEHPFPAALLDCYNVLEYYATHAEKEGIDASKIYFSGDSAGGNLTITTALLDHYVLKSNYIAKIVPFYPALDLASEMKAYWGTEDIYVKSKKDKKIIDMYISAFNSPDSKIGDWYSDGSDLKNPLISPINATDAMLKSLPPMRIIIGEFDPLRLQNDDFVERLESLGVPVSYKIYNGMLHAFMDKVGVYPEAEQGVDDAIDFIFKGEN